MATIMWAKSAAGTNLGFVRDLGRILKSWREILHSNLPRKQVPTKTKVQNLELYRPDGKEKCLPHFQPTGISRSSKSLQSRIFHSVFARTTTRTVASELRRQAAQRLSSSSSRNFRNMPIMSLIGVTLGVNLTSVMDDGTERMMSELQENFRSYTWQTETLDKLPTCLDDLLISEKSIANGCEGAVYKAKIKPAAGSTEPMKTENDSDYNLAVKAMFNYGAESNAHSILSELEREIVPLRPEGCQLETPLGKRVGQLPPHPNIVDMPGIFVDDMLVTEEGLKKFPAAMPQRLDPEHFYGHNKTLYLVMRRRSSHLRDFLSRDQMEPISMATRCQILAQLLEGVAHLTKHGVAHRDLKADNILVDFPETGGLPWM
ncbi:serine/threonine-protein kinase pink1, mitochondrial [Plakobranchus ocellatus]|uniref:non-specific serine/threonine protein kinase n=1 Tax=Plakobranchus ocellatus TaxID=259542 RepID=A0AAV3Z7C6_9GAST|nr:serine/threonine-protein kinase pink1, mitochondrial [Plakobranchus ocellatus]